MTHTFVNHDSARFLDISIEVTDSKLKVHNPLTEHFRRVYRRSSSFHIFIYTETAIAMFLFKYQENLSSKHFMRKCFVYSEFELHHSQGGKWCECLWYLSMRMVHQHSTKLLYKYFFPFRSIIWMHHRIILVPLKPLRHWDSVSLTTIPKYFLKTLNRRNVTAASKIVWITIPKSHTIPYCLYST